MGLEETFRRNLRELMDDRGLTIREVAEWSCICANNLQRQTSGVAPFTLRAIEKICEGLKVDPLAMLEEV